MNDPGGLKRPTRQQRTDGSAKASAEPFHLDHDLWDGICQLSCSIYFDFYGRGGGVAVDGRRLHSSCPSPVFEGIRINALMMVVKQRAFPCAISSQPLAASFDYLAGRFVGDR